MPPSSFTSCPFHPLLAVGSRRENVVTWVQGTLPVFVSFRAPLLPPFRKLYSADLSRVPRVLFCPGSPRLLLPTSAIPCRPSNPESSSRNSLKNGATGIKIPVVRAGAATAIAFSSTAETQKKILRDRFYDRTMLTEDVNARFKEEFLCYEILRCVPTFYVSMISKVFVLVNMELSVVFAMIFLNSEWLFAYSGGF